MEGERTAAKTPTPEPEPSKTGAKEWVKNKLKSLGSMLARLGQKALSALPGLIGTVVSWLFNKASEVVGWFAKNLWAFILAIASLLYLAVKAYITRKSRCEHRKCPAAKKAKKN